MTSRLRPASTVFFAFLFFSLLAGKVQADERPTLRVCLLENNLPFSSSRQQSGFDLDTAKAVAEAMGRSLTPVWVKNDPQIAEIEDSDFPLRRLARSECDAVFSVPGADAVKGSPTLMVGAPYYGAAFELIGRGGSVPSSLEALGDTLVAVQSQTVANFVLSARKTKMRTFFSVEAALNALPTSEATVALLWGPTTGWHLHNHPELHLTFATGYVPPVVVRWNEHVATRKRDATLRKAIDAVLVRLTASGTLQACMARYGIPFRQPFATTYNMAEMEKLGKQGSGVGGQRSDQGSEKR